jgi:hypothetical protein
MRISVFGRKRILRKCRKCAAVTGIDQRLPALTGTLRNGKQRKRRIIKDLKIPGSGF